MSFLLFMETILFKGKKPTMEDLYIHIHCARQNGVSPVVAQLSAAEESEIQITENSESHGGVNPAAEETSASHHEFDVNSLQFTNHKKEKAYVSTILLV